MSNYSIKDLEQLSGIKAHTLRIWEQRYNLLSPKRTDTNIRYYDDSDLRLILNVALLNDNGYKISKIASMDDVTLREEVMKLSERSFAYNDQIHALTLSMIEMDEERFEKILNSNIKKLGFEQTMLNIIYPFMGKIGVLWQTGAINPGQEHFISNLVRQKMIVAIDSQTTKSTGKKFLLYLPDGELHEISLLFAYYLIKSKGHKVLYLGQSTPTEDLNYVCQVHKPDYILTVLTTAPILEEVESYVNSIADRFSYSKILVTGHQVLSQEFSFASNVQQLNYIRDIHGLLEEIESVPQEK
ncbi:DNA-binding transcriptional MerR regulator [Algoriphagus boseongensis]|uniref:DNA-binding transcriptional MerR regulator n=1 Tax=Algoriphagus boseongensis TaxID=1442587 RepID=A0A4R6T4N1_9BACT|nr:MerR family transcriptional regulator [Algoriphagus boseongensis]TDQ16929.1 DNA-binding transcriptional MerR regulator [Algoriphagus boseongensis]